MSRNTKLLRAVFHGVSYYEEGGISFQKGNGSPIDFLQRQISFVDLSLSQDGSQTQLVHRDCSQQRSAILGKAPFSDTALSWFSMFWSMFR